MELTLYQINDVINGINSNIIASQAIFLTIVSAYLVVAYTVGRDLTKYQVGFVSLIFSLFMLVDIFTTYNLIQDVYEHHKIKMEMLEMKVPSEAVSEIIRWIFVSIRLVVTLGALTFMWQVRRTDKK